MLPIQTILNTTDFSVQSQYAFPLACALARDYGARLVVLHVVVPPLIVYGEGLTPPEPEMVLADARERLNQLQIPHDSIRAERLVEEGDPPAAILRVAQDVHADLIV